MKKIGLFLTIVLMISVSAGAQSLSDIAGSWQGDKALGNVYIEDDGTGILTFAHDSELTMKVKVTMEDGKYTIEQAEPNRSAYYSGIFDRAIAEPLAREARPMKWVFQLSRDGETLAGTKYTSSVEFNRNPPEFIACDNSYSRSSQWSRLSGQVAQPRISPETGKASGPVQVSLSLDTPGAQVYYTLDGSAPSAESGTPYRQPFTIDSTTTIKALGIRRGWQNSPVTEATYVFASSNISEDDGGDGMTIDTAKRIPVGTKKRFYHINDTNYTHMYYKFDVSANSIYEIRIWDKDDDEDKYDPNIFIVQLHKDLDKDETVPLMERGDRRWELVPSSSGTLYLELKNGYYEQSGRFEIRIQEVD